MLMKLLHNQGVLQLSVHVGDRKTYPSPLTKVSITWLFIEKNVKDLAGALEEDAK